MATRQKRSLERSMAVLRGLEPALRKDTFREDLVRALNWYNANWEEKDYRKAAEHYIKHAKMKDCAQIVSKASFLEIRPIGAIGRMIDNGQFIDLDCMEKFFSEIEKLKAKYPAKVKAVAVSQGVAAPVVSVQERIAESAHNLAGEVEGAIDEYLSEGTEFSMKSFLASKQVSGVVAKKIGSLFKNTVKELQLAVGGKDAQLVEGYSQYTKRGLKQYLQLIEQIVADCEQQVVSAKAVRKPRARKVKPPSVVAAKVKYMKEFADLKLRSVEPAKIIGASEAWVYIPTKRKLTVFRGADNGFLGVRGTSIINYDVEKSETKTVRKPEQFFKDLSSTGKRAMNNAWKAIRAKVSKPRARLSEEMIIVAVN